MESPKPEDAFFQVALYRVQDQERLAANMNARAGRILSVAAGMAGVSAAIVNFAANRDTAGGVVLPTGSIYLLILLAATFLAAGLCCIMVIFPRGDWNSDPDLEFFRAHLPHFRMDGTESAFEWAGRNLTRSYEGNLPFIDRQAKHLRLAIVFLIAQVLELIVLAAITV